MSSLRSGVVFSVRVYMNSNVCFTGCYVPLHIFESSGVFACMSYGMCVSVWQVYVDISKGIYPPCVYMYH